MAPLNKATLQSQADDFGKQIEKLAKAKASLEKDLSQTIAGIEARDHAITDAMITGTDYSKDLDMQQREKSKADNLRAAIAQSDKKIEDLKTEQWSNNNKIGMIDLLAADDAAGKQILFALQKIRSALEAIEGLKDNLAEINRIAGAYAMNADYIDETAGTLKIYQYMRNWITPDGTASFRYQLDQLEQAYPSKLKEIRAKFPS